MIEIKNIYDGAKDGRGDRRDSEGGRNAHHKAKNGCGGGRVIPNLAGIISRLKVFIFYRASYTVGAMGGGAPWRIPNR